jgi:hypothetical protein
MNFFFFFFINNLFLLKLVTFVTKAFYFDVLFFDVFFERFLNRSYFFSYKVIEKGLFELFGPIFVYIIFNFLYKVFSKFNTGLVYEYFFFMILSLICIFFYFEFIIFLNYLLLIIVITFGFTKILKLINFVKFI